MREAKGRGAAQPISSAPSSFRPAPSPPRIPLAGGRTRPCPPFSREVGAGPGRPLRSPPPHPESPALGSAAAAERCRSPEVPARRPCRRQHAGTCVPPVAGAERGEAVAEGKQGGRGRRHSGLPARWLGGSGPCSRGRCLRCGGPSRRAAPRPAGAAGCHRAPRAPRRALLLARTFGAPRPLPSYWRRGGKAGPRPLPLRAPPPSRRWGSAAGEARAPQVGPGPASRPSQSLAAPSPRRGGPGTPPLPLGRPLRASPEEPRPRAPFSAPAGPPRLPLPWASRR